MKKILTTLLLSISLTAAAQITPGKFSFALPEHPGNLSLNQGNFKITELSAKPGGREFGVRAEDRDRRANTLKGEPFPDPAADDSIQKLKPNKDFWTFVEGLSKQIRKS